MYRYSFILFLVYNSVFCEDCVTVDFENGLEGNFTNTYGRCFGLPMWDIGNYSSFNITGPHPDSTKFVTLQPTWTCMTSFIFTMTRGGILEVNALVGFRDNTDLVWVDIIQYVDGGNDLFVSQGGFYPSQVNVVPAWRTLRIPLPGSGIFEGYIMFWGVASSKSVFLMDSFRYIAPSLDEELCQIYTEEKTTTTTNVPTTTVNTEFPTLPTSTESPITTELPITEPEISTIITSTSELPTTATITELPTTTSKISTITTITTESPTSITIATELPTTTTGISATITTTEYPTITTEILTTTTEIPTAATIITESPDTTTDISTESDGTTPGTSTESPRYSIYYILIVKIKRYFEKD